MQHDRGPGNRGANDTLRIVLIALGVVLLVAALPLLFMSVMMGMMMGAGMLGGMGGMMPVLTLLVLAAGAAALTAGIRR